MRAFLKPRSLRWRFMLPPILGAALILTLAFVLAQISRAELERLEELHTLAYQQIQKISNLSGALADNHADVYQLLEKVEEYEDEGAFYRDSKSLLNEVHRINTALLSEMDGIDLAAPELAAVDELSVLLDQYLVTTTNALLMATVDQSRTRAVMTESTSRFNGLNSAFLALNRMISARIEQEILSAKERMQYHTYLFAAFFAAAAALMLVAGYFFSRILSGDLRELISKLDGILSQRSDESPRSPANAGVIDTLSNAVDRVTENYALLEKTQNELTRVNDDLSRTIDRQKALIEAQRVAEEARDRALEEAQKANDAKTQFLANMSHELRTPLNAIIGFSDIIRTAMLGPINERYQEYADNISTAGGHLLEILTDILDVSRIEAGKFEVNMEPIDVQDTFEACRTLLRLRAKQSGVELRMIVPDDFPLLQSDTLRIRQVLTNVIDNAIKFSPKGSQVQVSATLTEDNRIKFVVSDEGVGIAPEDIPRVLENFGQVRSSAQHAHGGTGLGLSIAKSLVELLDGELEIESTLGKGTSVQMTFSPHRTTFPPDRHCKSQ